MFLIHNEEYLKNLVNAILTILAKMYLNIETNLLKIEYKMTLLIHKKLQNKKEKSIFL